ncbi:MAG: hypothetical protein ACPGQS_14010, partial [Bradymonadia bacterium]
MQLRDFLLFGTFLLFAGVNIAQAKDTPARLKAPNDKALYDSTIKSAWKLTKGTCGDQISACMKKLNSGRKKACKGYRKCTSTCKSVGKKSKKRKTCARNCRKKHLNSACRKARKAYVSNVLGCGLNSFSTSKCKEKLKTLAARVQVPLSSKMSTSKTRGATQKKLIKGPLKGPRTASVAGGSGKLNTQGASTSPTQSKPKTPKAVEPPFECHGSDAKMMAAYLQNMAMPRPKKLGRYPNPKASIRITTKSNEEILKSVKPKTTTVHAIYDSHTAEAKWLQQTEVDFGIKVKAKGAKGEFKVCALLIDPKNNKSRTLDEGMLRFSSDKEAVKTTKLSLKLAKYHGRWGKERRLVSFLVSRNTSKTATMKYTISLTRSKPQSVKKALSKTEKASTSSKNRSAGPAKGPSVLTLARIAGAAYASNLDDATSKSCSGDTCMPRDYRNKVLSTAAIPYFGKFQAVAVLNEKTSPASLVISYRGTWSTGSLHADVGLFLATMGTYSAPCIRRIIKYLDRVCPLPGDYGRKAYTCLDKSSTETKKCSSSIFAYLGYRFTRASYEATMSKLAATLSAGERFYEGAIRKAKKRLKGKSAKVYITGHSLGGYIASYVASRQDNPHIETTVFNAPPGARYIATADKRQARALDVRIGAD